jgi:hypothetical protein
VGIDWYRVKVKAGTDRARLESLVVQQASGAQALYGWSPTSRRDAVGYELRKRLNFESYCAASRELQSLLEFPTLDQENHCATDIPDLSLCWRITHIAGNDTFPPLWRVQAHSSFLPGQLPAQVARWRNWSEQVISGEHDDYARELHMYHVADFLEYHVEYLRDVAQYSLQRTNNWTKKPELEPVREAILRLPRPGIEAVAGLVRIDPADNKKYDRIDITVRYNALIKHVEQVLELTRAWNRLVPHKSRVPYDGGTYSLTLDEFKEWASSAWLNDFLEWAERCVALGFGFYYDY